MTLVSISYIPNAYKSVCQVADKDMRKGLLLGGHRSTGERSLLTCNSCCIIVPGVCLQKSARDVLKRWEWVGLDVILEGWA